MGCGAILPSNLGQSVNLHPLRKDPFKNSRKNPSPTSLSRTFRMAGDRHTVINRLYLRYRAVLIHLCVRCHCRTILPAVGMALSHGGAGWTGIFGVRMDGAT